MLHRNQTDTVTFMVSKPRTRFVDPCFSGILDGLELALSAQGVDFHSELSRFFHREVSHL